MKPLWISLFCLSFFLSLQPSSQGSPFQIKTLRIEVSLVTVGVRVTDEKGREVSGLREEDFRVLEDRVKQPIAFFANEEQPVSLGILMDRSQSMGEGDKLSRAQRAAQMLLRAGHPANEFLFIPFDHAVSGSTGFDTDRDRIAQRIAATSAGGGTSLYDAILEGLDHTAAAKYRKQVMVVITDGADQHSRHTLDLVIQRLLHTQVQIYLIGYFTPAEDEAFRLGDSTITLEDGKIIDNPRVVFERLAAESGAEAFFPTSEEALGRVIEAINVDLRTQYTIAYYPPNPTQNDKYRQIRVEVKRRGVKVRARRGYILGRDSKASSPTQDTAPEDLRTDKGYYDEREKRPAPKSAPLTRCEDFSNPSSGWPVRDDASYDGGSYRLRGTNVLVTNRPEMSDFRVTLRIEVRSNVPSGDLRHMSARMTGAGLVFRASLRGCYAVIVYFDSRTSAGACVVIRQDGDKVTELARWPASVLPGRSVDLRVAVAGEKIESFLGGRFLGAVRDNRLRAGVFGLVLSGSGEARFDDLCLEAISPHAGSANPD